MVLNFCSAESTHPRRNEVAGPAIPDVSRACFPRAVDLQALPANFAGEVDAMLFMNEVHH